MTAEIRTVKLVRLREGVDVFGRKVGENSRPSQLSHLVRATADLDSPDGVTACCGLEFAPGTLVEVAWIESLPHGGCLRRSPWSRQRIEAEFLAANVMPGPEVLPGGIGEDALAILGVIPELAANIAAASRIFGSRDGWMQDSDGVPTWEYSHSFGGVLVGEKRFPRNHDLGLHVLTAEVVKTGVLRIRSCGVLGGCSLHAVHSEDVPLDNVALIEERLTHAEQRARAVGLERLSWCLIVGFCSVYPSDGPAPGWETACNKRSSERDRKGVDGRSGHGEGLGDAAEARGGSGKGRPPASPERCGSA